MTRQVFVIPSPRTRAVATPPNIANVPPNWVTAGVAGQCAGWACGASRRRAQTPARRDQDAPRQPCRTMPACIAPAFFRGNCVCVRILPRGEIKEADIPNSEVDSP